MPFTSSISWTYVFPEIFLIRWAYNWIVGKLRLRASQSQSQSQPGLLSTVLNTLFPTIMASPAAAAEDDGYRLPQGSFRFVGNPTTIYHPDHDEDGCYFPPAIHNMAACQWAGHTLTIRELYMLWFVEQITNKPDWHKKVFDDTIVAKWKAELAPVDWTAIVGFENGSYSDAMFAYTLEELRAKAVLYEKTGLIPVFDTAAAIVKSDSAISPELKEELKAAAAVLENVPEHLKDWHPRSDNQVLDLVHPSLWPLVFGRTRYVTDKRITLENCLDACGIGEPIQLADDYDPTNSLWSGRFQWLPCDVQLEGGKAKIVSYINNLHPKRHQRLYSVVEKFIEKSLPLWDVVYRWPSEFGQHLERIKCTSVYRECTSPEVCAVNGYCDAGNRPLEEGELPEEEANETREEQDARYERDKKWHNETHLWPQPDPEPFEEPILKVEDVRTEGFFRLDHESGSGGARRIQVIVKLANIHLTPEKPTYNGGSWHVEGLLNEHICSTALYYYDNENITDSHLAFRNCADREDMVTELEYEQNDEDAIRGVFAINGNDTLQEIGQTLTREGRLLTFPNVYQHRVSPFSLKDSTKPGHRKILALFLVDPRIPIHSTAQVPPQQRHWWLGTDDDGSEQVNWMPAQLPVELKEMVSDQMDWPIGLDEAKKTRLSLMDERTAHVSYVDERLHRGDWNFCEH